MTSPVAAPPHSLPGTLAILHSCCVVRLKPVCLTAQNDTEALTATYGVASQSLMTAASPCGLPAALLYAAAEEPGEAAEEEQQLAGVAVVEGVVQQEVQPDGGAAHGEVQAAGALRGV